MRLTLTNNEQVVGHRINPLEQRLGQGAKTDTTLWMGRTTEFRESILLNRGGCAAVGNVGYRSAIQKSNDALVFIPKFLKNRTENKQIH